MTRPQGLRAVTPAEAVETRAFCGHCGLEPDPAHATAGATRVCRHCDFGLVLEAAADVAPGPDHPFLVVDNRMAICALSEAAERLLGVDETTAVNRHLGEFLLPADANASGGESLIEFVLTAASGGGRVERVRVRPLGVFGVRFNARIGRCGPAPSAIVVLER
jgi:PAS domain-containing protein